MTSAIEIDNLSYTYGKSPVLDRISFSVGLKDFFIIIGPNGSGKTTLLKQMSGLLQAMGGSLKIHSRAADAYSRRDMAKTIAYVPQLIQTEFPFTALEVVLMGRSPHLGLLGVERQNDLTLAKEAMGYTGVAQLAERKMNQLSGGECQRVYIARAICQETDIMLLDEPTASLDLAHQVRVMDLMERLRQEKGVTVVMVSHDVNLAAMYGNRVLLLKAGQIVSIGAPGEVITFETLEDAYGCKLLIDENPLGGFPRVTLVPERFMDPDLGLDRKRS